MVDAVLPVETPWNYEASGTDQGTAWRDPGFDDSSWDSAQAFIPSVLITEAATGNPDYVEIQNVSEYPADTTGWVVAVNDARGVNLVHSTVWELPDSIAAGEVLYRDDVGTDPEHWGDGIYWTTPGPGWVMILDNQGNIADFVAWGYSGSDSNGLSCGNGQGGGEGERALLRRSLSDVYAEDEIVPTVCLLIQ